MRCTAIIRSTHVRTTLASLLAASAFALPACAAPADMANVPFFLAPLVALYQAQLEKFRQDRDAAVALATEPLGPLPDGLDPAELAAWTTIANVLLNLDGVLPRG